MNETLEALRSGTTKWRIGLVNGPNMSNLGRRPRAVYGDVPSIEALEERVARIAGALGLELAARICSNHEGEIIDWVQRETARLDAILINPAGLSRFGYAAARALADSGLPVIEVHFGNYPAKNGTGSIFTEASVGMSAGMRKHSYTAALVALAGMLDDRDHAGPGGTP